MTDFSKYADRIKYSGPLTPTLEVLTNLQKAHLYAVPFENLDIHYGYPIELNYDDFQRKIVVNNRGGFCYELNGLFYELLASVGFNVKRISARPYSNDRGYGPEFDHMAIITTIKNKDYLVDVGFGVFAQSPIKIEMGGIHMDKEGGFSINKYDDKTLQVGRKQSTNWIPEYLFTLKERSLEEFKDMCRYHQTSPKSHFTQGRICSIPTIQGRTTLTDTKLKINAEGQISEMTIKDEKQFQELLWEHFGMKIEINGKAGIDPLPPTI